jgi:transcriptional/translational regulatory protein YebC/TACO1
MSGHSKWSTIKRQKGVTDAKRGAAFTKVANAITIAARSGGESPETNFKLRLSIEDAKRINMPKGNIEKAIARGVGKAGEGAKLEELTYEGFGPGGVAIFERSGGSLAGPGSVSYLFSSTAQIAIDTKGEDPDEIVLVAADSGADDVDVEEGMGIVYCRPESLEKIKKELEGKNLKTTGTELSMKPKNTVKIEDKEKAAKVLDLMEKLDGLSDVQKVYANFDIPDEILQKEATSQ